MHARIIAMSVAVAVASAPLKLSAQTAEQEQRILMFNEALRVAHSMCITQGELEQFEFSAEANGGFALKRFGLGGEVTVIDRSSTARGIANGLESSIADQQLANTLDARKCMAENFYNLVEGLLAEDGASASILPREVQSAQLAAPAASGGTLLDEFSLVAFLEQNPLARTVKVTIDNFPLSGEYDAARQTFPLPGEETYKDYSGYSFTIISRDAVTKAYRIDFACNRRFGPCSFDDCASLDAMFRNTAIRSTGRGLEYSKRKPPDLWGNMTKDGKTIGWIYTSRWEGETKSPEIVSGAEFSRRIQFEEIDGDTVQTEARCDGFMEIVARD